MLIGFLGEDKVKLKMTSVKFGALIDGFRSLNGAQFGVGRSSNSWSSTETSSKSAKEFSLHMGEKGFDFLPQNKKGGAHVRCLKD